MSGLSDRIERASMWGPSVGGAAYTLAMLLQYLSTADTARPTEALVTIAAHAQAV